MEVTPHVAQNDKRRGGSAFDSFPLPLADSISSVPRGSRIIPPVATELLQILFQRGEHFQAAR